MFLSVLGILGTFPPLSTSHLRSLRNYPPRRLDNLFRFAAGTPKKPSSAAEEPSSLLDPPRDDGRLSENS